MILELTDKKGAKVKFCSVVYVCVLANYSDQLYYQQRYKRNGKEFINERFVPLESISRWVVR